MNLVGGRLSVWTGVCVCALIRTLWRNLSALPGEDWESKLLHELVSRQERIWGGEKRLDPRFVCLCFLVKVFFFIFKHSWTCTCQRDYWWYCYYNWGEKTIKKWTKPCYNIGENCQHLLLIGAYFIQCWCVVVLVHIVSFQSSPFFSCFWWGGTIHKREVGKIFCYCPIRGWQYVYIYIVYMWWKCVGFLCDTTFYLYLWFYIQCFQC